MPDQGIADGWGPGDWIAFVTAIAALATALAAGYAIRAADRRTRLQLGVNNLWSLIQQWDAPEMRRRRSGLASHLLRHPEARRHVSGEGVEVLNTFELLAYLVVRSGTLDREDAWVNFSVWATGWWYVYEAGIREIQQADRTAYEDYAELVNRFSLYEIERGLPVAADPQEGIEEFLRTECDLLESKGWRRWLVFAARGHH